MQSEKIQTDVCIVGAGPSGATASLFLAKAGIPHLILDAATFPRDKICGDGLDLKVLRVLQHLDPNIAANELFGNSDFLPSWGARLIAPNGQRNDFVYRPKSGEHDFPILWTSKRLHFDHFLVKKLDSRFADFRPNTKVEQVVRSENGWRISAKNQQSDLEIEAKILLGADGDHSVVLRSLGERKIERRHYAGTLRQYWRGLSDIHPQNLIEVYFPKGLPMSYFYIFPLPNGEANVGYGMVSEVAAEGKHNLRALFSKIITEDPIMAPRFRQAEPLETPQGWGIPMASRRRRNFGDGYLLLGDAASLVCPTSGEGIGTGMMSGLIAARFVERALAAGRFDADIFKNYNREVYRRLHDEIRLFNTVMTFKAWWAYDLFLNLAVPSQFYQWVYKRKAGSWLHTALEKEIPVNL